MIRISILYPNTGRFDKDYYLNVHMPLSVEKQGEALKGISVEIGINVQAPGHFDHIAPIYKISVRRNNLTT